MIPKSTAGRWFYAAVSVVCLLLLGFCVAVTIWENTIEDGWISANAAMFLTWLICGPLIPVPLAWSLGLLIARRRAEHHAADSGINSVD